MNGKWLIAQACFAPIALTFGILLWPQSVLVLWAGLFVTFSFLLGLAMGIRNGFH